MISMPDSTMRASHAGAPYSTIQIAAATASGVAIMIPMTRQQHRPEQRVQEAARSPSGRPGCGREISSRGCRYCSALEGHVDDDRRRRSRTARCPHAQHSAKAMRSLQRHVRRRLVGAALARRPARGRSELGAAVRRPSDAHPVLLHRLLGDLAADRQDEAREQQQQRERVDVACTAGALSDSTSSTIVAASGRSGSKMKVRPSAGFGAKPLEPETIESMIASPSARAQASTAAGDDRRPRGAHRHRPHRAPAVDAQRDGALLPAARDRVERVDDDRDHDRRDHHREDHDRRRAGPCRRAG